MDQEPRTKNHEPNTMDHFKTALNEEQYRAVTAPPGPILVLAAAGTGKTRTLVYRVAYLVKKGISADRILLLTFTNRAAREMLERAERLVGPGISGIWGGTFHHMANRILRKHARAIGWNSNYTILDRDDSKTLVSDCIKERKLKNTVPKPDVLLGLFSSAANTETSLSELVEKKFTDIEMDSEKILAVYDDYRKKKKSLDSMDFDDLLINCLSLFREKKEIMDRYQEQFEHVLVDEYQDTNTIQAEMVDRISRKNRNVLVVGDDFQSIYSWRGADFLNIMSFPDRYPDTVTHKLETNYRSVPEVLEVANACIARNPHQFQKTLRATRDAYKKPEVIVVRDGDEQARYIVEHIRKLCRAGYKLSEIAVLYRAHFHAMELQLYLTRERIAYVITSGVRFFEQVHIKDVCTILRLIENNEDEMAFCRMLAFLPGVGSRTALKIWRKTGNRFDALKREARQDVRNNLRPDAQRGWDDICRVFEEREDDLDLQGGDLIHRFVQVFYELYAANTFENHERRLDDIMELAIYMARFESIEQFLSEVALLTNLDAELEDVDGSSENAVRLSTVHQAKGQEWPAVILLWMADGMFPSGRTLNESEDGESEERRLFYVAVTRARDELCLCVPEIRRKRDGSIMYCVPSRFVTEIPEGMVTEIHPGFI